MTKRILFCALQIVVIFALGHDPAGAAELPKSTQEMLKQLKLPASFLADMDKELEVPRDWMDKAKSEGKVRFMSTEEIAEAKTMLAPFRERYPFINVEFLTSARPDRIKVLVAYKSGKITTDVLDAITGSLEMLLEAKALNDVTDIPNLRNLPDEAHPFEGVTVATESGVRCIAYHTRYLKREDLGKKWDDLLSSPKLKDHNLALGNRPELWLANLWASQGEAWARNFVTRLFTELKPQLRKEGMNALHQFVAAGEFHAFIPAGEDTTLGLAKEGAPVGFACPEPVPWTVRHLGIIRGTPSLYASKVFVNWLLSKEGQIGRMVAKGALPIHKGLMRRELIPWADEILGKTASWRPHQVELQSKVARVWSELWTRPAR